MADFNSDPMLSRYVEQRFAQLRDLTKSPEMKNFAQDVLDGKVSVRDALQSDVFRRALTAGAEAQIQKMKQMSIDELARVAQEGEKEFINLLEGDQENEKKYLDGDVQKVGSQHEAADCEDSYYEKNSWLEG